MTIVFNLVSVALVLFIVWWFWIAKSKAKSVEGDIVTIYVKDGVYSPDRIETQQSTITLNFIRQDPSACSEYILFDQLDIYEKLPLNETHAIVLTKLKPGVYQFNCQMNMYKGQLIIH